MTQLLRMASPSLFRRALLLLVGLGSVLLCSGSSLAQTISISGVVNHYAAVVSIDYCRNQAAVSSASEFAVGDRVMIIQMQEAVADIVDTTGSGSQGQIYAGLYEMNDIGAIAGDTLVFRTNLLHAYSVSGRVQVVSMPKARNLDVVGPIDGQPWNGRTGGIVALEATDTIYLHADINVKGMGFRGGALSDGLPQCSVLGGFAAAADGVGGRKGEGIVLIASKRGEAGRAHVANAGGGGNARGAGGGGGGNIQMGGSGGNQWSGCGGDTIGGVGGASLEYYRILNRIYMGGGGGAGHAVGAGGTAGSNGGGIVLLQGNALVARNHVIEAGAAAITATATSNGAGGGGAGGTVALNIANFVDDVSVHVPGADGGSVICSGGECYGPGGGGGGGVVIVPGSVFPPNVHAGADGGMAGRVTSPGSICDRSPNGAYDGVAGGVLRYLQVGEGAVPFSLPAIGITAPVLEARPGDTVSLPLLLRAANLSLAKVSEYTLTLTLNKDLLLPIAGTPAGTIAQLDRVYTFGGPAPDTSIDLGTYRYLVLNSPSAMTPLTFQLTLKGAQCPVDTQLVSGSVSVLLCDAGGQRLVRAGKPSLLRAVEPNPARGIATVAYDLIEDGQTRLTLTDASGRTVATLVDGVMTAGSHVAQFDATALASGRYICVLTTPTDRLTTEIQVVH